MAFATTQHTLSSATAGPIAQSIVILLVGYGLWCNRQLRSMWFIGLGLLCNGLVIISNQGHMPVGLEALQKAGLGNMTENLAQRSDAVHSLMGANTPFWFLGDIIPLNILGYQNVLSLGDVYLLLGIVGVIIEGGLLAKRKNYVEPFEFELEF